MVPKAKYVAWVHCDVVNGKMLCKYCKHPMGGWDIFRLKQHLAGIRGQVTPRDVLDKVIGLVRAEYLEKFEKFKDSKAIQEEIARKKELAKAMSRREAKGFGDFDLEDTSIPSTNLHDPFRYVPPHLGSHSQAKSKMR